MKLDLKINRIKIENFLVFLFFLVLPFEKRHIFFNFGYQFADFSAISIYASDIIAVALLIIAFSRKNYLKTFFKQKIFLIMLAFLLFETMISPHGTFTYYSEVKWLELILIFGYFAVSEVSYATILKSISVSGFFQALVGMAQFIKQRSVGLSLLGEVHISPMTVGIAKIATKSGVLIRSYGTFAHANQLAAFISVTCATTIILLLKENERFQKMFYVLVIFLLILGELLSFSRAGWGALLIILLFTLFYSRETNPRPEGYKSKVILIVLATIIAAGLVWPLLVNRAKLNDPSVISRIYYDQVGLKVFEKQPLFGVGLGGLMPAVAKVENVSQNWQVQPPHNFFIDVACETGVFGLAIILFVFGKLIYDLIKRFKKGDRETRLFKIFLFCTFLAFIFLMQFDHYFYTLQQTQLLLWAILGIICGTVFRETNKEILTAKGL